MSGSGAALMRGRIEGDWSGGHVARVLVVFEPCRAGRATMREAAEMASAGSELSVVALAPQARPQLLVSGGGAGPYNIAIREEAAEDLREARSILGSLAGRATFEVLAGCPEPPLAAWAAERAFDVVLLPFHRLTRGGSRHARPLRQATDAEVRLVR